MRLEKNCSFVKKELQNYAYLKLFVNFNRLVKNIFHRLVTNNFNRLVTNNFNRLVTNDFDRLVTNNFNRLVPIFLITIL